MKKKTIGRISIQFLEFDKIIYIELDDSQSPKIYIEILDNLLIKVKINRWVVRSI
jgi:hypothetical protein